MAFLDDDLYELVNTYFGYTGIFRTKKPSRSGLPDEILKKLAKSDKWG
jgi:hypothetical protein